MEISCAQRKTETERNEERREARENDRHTGATQPDTISWRDDKTSGYPCTCVRVYVYWIEKVQERTSLVEVVTKRAQLGQNRRPIASGSSLLVSNVTERRMRRAVCNRSRT